MLKKVFKRFFLSSWAFLLILLGTLTWSVTMFKSGLVYSYGMGFWGPNGHDGVWHIALIESLAAGKWQIPVFAGEALKNYHVGFDILVALLYKLTSIPIVNLYFQIVPVFLAFLIGVLTYKFVYLWQKSRLKSFWAVFFVYFAGSWGWIITLIRDGSLGGESMFWSQQAISTLINPPFALSLVFILAGLIFLVKYQKTQTIRNLVLTTLFFGLLIQIKVYAGLLVLGGLFIGGIWGLVKSKNYNILQVFTSSLVLSLIIFLPFNKNAGSLIIFKPFWFLETMMGFSDRVAWERFYSAMTNYRLGGQWIKATLAYLVAFLIFWYGNMGTRFVKEFLVFKRLKNIRKISWVEVFFASVIVLGGVIPMFFLQKGTPWNTIQFFYYSLFMSGILAGVALGEWLESKHTTALRNAVVGAVVLFTIPTTIGTLKHYLPSRPPAKLSRGELAALKFLSSQQNGVILTYPFDREAAKVAEAKPPRPLYLYESTAYVTAFSKMPVFLEDEINLDITNYDWPSRREEVFEFLNTLNQEKSRKFLRENKISYVYWVGGQRAKLGESQLGLVRIFENEEVDIYRVK